LMSDWSAEKFAQRIFDLALLDNMQIEGVWGELGSRDVSLEEITSVMLRKGLLTNLQIERIMRGERQGFFYGKYKLLYLVGAGTFARVYRAVHVDKGSVAAVKVLRNRFLNDISQQEQFLREGKMVMELRHPNIVPVYEVGAERHRKYMVMEFVEGDNLREILKVRKKFNPIESLKLMADIASGLDFAFGKGVTHRDLKLSNVLLTSSGRAKLVDFGLAALAATEKEKGDEKSTNARSIDYAGLERVTGVKKDDKQSDIFFTGCMLYQILTGVSPMSETRDRSQRLSVARFREIKPITLHEPDLPGSLVNVVNKAMELDPEKRYATPGNLLLDLQNVLRRLESGDTGDGTVEGEGGKRLLEREGEGHSVMIVESNIEMQDALRDLLKRRGYRVLVVGDARRAIGRFEMGGDPPAECVVFCTTEMGEEALEAFNAFGENEDTKHIPAVLFIAEKHQDYAARAATADHRQLLPMPLKVRQLRAMLLKLLAKK
ncbi:MAG TPA: protein kinase, partial [Pirellulaceae bacterium]|nr:protein kinase [Pirellulaceae bacterium]